MTHPAATSLRVFSAILQAGRFIVNHKIEFHFHIMQYVKIKALQLNS